MSHAFADSRSPRERNLRQTEAVFTYLRVIESEHKQFPLYFFSKEFRKTRMKQILYYWIEYMLKLTPQQALDRLTISDFQIAHLAFFIHYVKETELPEWTESRAIAYLLHWCYPELEIETEEDRIRWMHEQVLLKKAEFPLFYFTQLKGEYRAIVCLQHAAELEGLKLSQLNKINHAFLRKYKISKIYSLFFDSVKEFVSAAFPAAFQTSNKNNKSRSF